MKGIKNIEKLILSNNIEEFNKLILEKSPSEFKIDEIPFLYIAVKSRNKEIAKLLIEKEANIEAYNPNSGLTPLKLAISQKDIEMIKFLIEKGININNKDSNSFTALHMACYKGS